MCSSTPKHRPSGLPTRTSTHDQWPVAIGGPRHAAKATTYARYVGRVGALAVSLGVGMAMAKGVAHAEPASESSDSATAGAAGGGASTAGAGAASQSNAESNTESNTDTSTGINVGAGSGTGVGSGTATDTPPRSGSSTPATSSDDRVPAMNVSSSGGAHTSTHSTTKDVPEKDAAPTESEAPALPEGPPSQPVPTQPAGPTGTTDPTGGTAPTAAPETAGERPAEGAAPEQAAAKDGPARPAAAAPTPHRATTVTAAAANTADPGAADGPDAAQQAAPTTMSVTATDPAPQAVQSNASPTVPAPPADPVAALLAAPGVIINAFTGFVGSLLTPFLTPGPAAPIQLPSLWTVLAWVRREIDHTFFNRSPIVNPVQLTGQSTTGVVTGLLNAVDPNGDPLTAYVTQQGRYGTVVINPNGTYTYTPRIAVPAQGLTDSFTIAVGDGPDMHLGGLLGVVQHVFETVARFFGIAQPDTVVKTVAVSVVGSAVGIPPVVVTTVVGPVATPNGPAVTLDSSVVVADLDSGTLKGATVKIGLGFAQGDRLTYTPTAGNPITGSYDAATGTLTLTGTATVEQYQAALRSITFDTTSSAVVAVKNVTMSVTDPQNLSSLPALVVVTMLALSLPPLVVTTAVGPIVKAGDPPVRLDPLVVVADLDSQYLKGAVVTIGAGYAAGDRLAFTPLSDNPIQGSYDATTGTLTLTGAATAQQYQDALRSVTFATTAATLGVRTVSIVATDATDVASPPGLVGVTVVDLNLPPVVLTTVLGPNLVPGDPPRTLDGQLVVTDLDSPTLSGATVKIGLGFTPGDTLAFTPLSDNPIRGSYDTATGTLTLTGAASAAQYQDALRAVTISTSSTASGVIKALTVVVTDDQGLASAPGLITVTGLGAPVNVPPLVVTTGLLTYSAGTGPRQLDGTILVADVDSPLLSGATLTLGGAFTSATDALNYAAPQNNPIQGSYDAATGTLTLTGTATVAQYQEALRAVTFSSSATTPVGVRAVTIEVTDAGAATSPPALVAITVVHLPVNVPSIVATSAVLAYTAGGAPKTLDPLLTVIDVDTTELAGATVTIGAGYDKATDTLAYTGGAGPISAHFDTETGTLVLTGSATVAQYQAALRAVTFATTSSAVVGVRTVGVVVTDADAVAGLPGTVAVVVASLPTQIPSVVLTSGLLTYSTGSGPKALDPLLTVVDVDSDTLSRAVVKIGVGFDPLADTLAYGVTGGPITGQFDSATGELVLSGSATVAAYQQALRAVTFSTSGAAVGARTVSVVVSDAADVPSAPGLVAVVIAGLPGSVPGVVATVPVKVYTGRGAADVLDPLATVIDVDSTSATKATVTIGGYTAGDTLAYTGTGTISGTYAGGVLTLQGPGTVADYQAALRAVTFASTDAVGVRTISMTLTSDGVQSAPSLMTLTIASLPTAGNVASLVAATPVKLYTSNGQPVVLDPLVTILDPDSPNVDKATVTITGYAPGDVLAYGGTGTITGSYAGGVLTLQGAGTVADYQAALRAVTFASTGPVGVRSVAIVVTADGVSSAPTTTLLTVATLPVVGNTPALVATSPAALYTAGGQAVVLDERVTILDPDSPNVDRATVTITGYTSADTLAYTGNGTISGTYADGVLTLQGAGTVADYQAALRAVTFASTDTAGVRAISIVVTADGVSSVPTATVLTIAALPVTGNVGSLVVASPVRLYTGAGAATVLDPTITILDPDSTIATGATVTIGGYQPGDVLAYGGTGPITGTFTGGVLTLQGDATLEQYQDALRQVTFGSPALLGVRTLSIDVTADGVTSAPALVTVTLAQLPIATDVPPVVATTPVKLYVAGGQAVQLDSLATVLDPDSTVTRAVVTIGGYQAGDVLGYAGSGTITGTFSGGVLTLQGDGTAAQYQAALRDVTFAATVAGIRDVSIVVTAGGLDSAASTMLLTVAALPVAPNAATLIAVTPVKLYTQGGAAVVLDPLVTLVDVDSDAPTRATVAITDYDPATDRLGYTGTGAIVADWDAQTGVLTLSGTGTVAQYQDALRSVTFASTATLGVRTVAMTVTADGVTNVPTTTLVTVATLPVVTNTPSLVAVTPAALYTTIGQPMVLDGGIRVLDPDSTTATKATVRIAAGYATGSDVLSYGASGAIAATFDAVTGTLTLTGPGTVADYQAALRQVAFQSSATVGVRTISIVLTADGVDSAPTTTLVTVAALPAVTNTPAVVAALPVKLYTGGGSAVVLDPLVTVIDVDSPSPTAATVAIGVGYVQGQDTLGYTGSGGISGSWNAATGVLTLTGTGTTADYETALRQVTFASTATAGVRTVAIVVTADGVPSAPTATAVTIAALPVPVNVPSVLATTPVRAYTSGTSPLTLDPAVTVIDVDSPTVTRATVTINGLGYQSGADTLGFANGGGITGSWDAGTGTLVLSGPASLQQFQDALRTVTFASTGTIGVRTVSIVVTADGVDSTPGLVAVTVVAPAANVPPLITTSLGRTYTAGSTAIGLDPLVTVLDVNSATLTGATVTIGTGRTATDVIGYVAPQNNPIQFAYDSATGVATLTGSATVAQYQEALRALTFSSSSTAPQGIRVVTLSATDVEGATGPAATLAVTVLANQAPLVVGSLLNAIPYVAGNDAVVLDPFVVVADDSTQIKGATVRITAGRQTGDVLGFTNAFGITGSYDGATGILSLTGTTTVENYQAALRSVTFATTSTALLGLRTFTMDVTDAQNLTGTSLPFTASVLGNALPLLTVSPGSLSVSIAGTALPRVVDPNFTIADDSTKLKSASVTVSGGVYVLASDAVTVSLPVGSPISANWDSSARTLTLTGDATAAQYQAALQSVTWNINGTISLGTRTFTFKVTDQQGAQATTTSSISIISLL